MTSIWMRRLAIASVCLSAAMSSAWAADEATDAQKLAFIRGMSKISAHPPLTGLAAAQPAPDFKAPPGEHSHGTAWRTGGGCVVFFASPSEVSDVSIKVTGDIKCNGKPIEGKGEVLIKRKDGDEIVLGVLNGSFSAGMLTGQAVKANFVYDLAGKPKQQVYVFRGKFANSVLNGEGESRWIGAPKGMPSAWAKQGNFVDGVATGWVAWIRQHPWEGVEGDIHQLATNPKGLIYVEQSNYNEGKLVEGTMFFENDPSPWKVETARWRDGAPSAARLTRADDNGTYLITVCEKWDFAETRIACDKGQAGHGRYGAIRGISNAAFTIPLPVQGNGLAFRPAPGTQMMLAASGDDVPATCNADYSRCKSMQPGMVSLSWSLYWYGLMEFRDGGMTASGAGKLYKGSPERKNDPSRDALQASCDDIASTLECKSGKFFFDDGGNFVGPWLLEGVRLEKDAKGRLAYVPADPTEVETRDANGEKKIKRVSNIHLNPRGWGRMNFPDGSWARVRVDTDGDFDDVGDCDNPKSSANYTCKLEDGVVVFMAERGAPPARQRAPQTQSYQPPAQYSAPERFVPQVIPQRPQYVLPGMR